MRKPRFKKSKRKNDELEVDITSLLDILTILLVFLLKSYNPSDLKLEVAKHVTIPDSKTRKLGHASIIVQVGADRGLWINNTRIGKVGKGKSEKIDILYDKLVKHKEKNKKIISDLESRTPANVDNMALKSRKASQKKINLVMDQSLPYSVLRKVMHTSAMAGFPEFKFIVQGNF